MPKTPDYHPQYVVHKIVTCREVVFPLRHTALWLARRLQVALFSGFWSQGEMPVLDENMSGTLLGKYSPNQECYFRSRALCHKNYWFEFYVDGIYLLWLPPSGHNICCHELKLGLVWWSASWNYHQHIEPEPFYGNITGNMFQKHDWLYVCGIILLINLKWILYM